MADTAGFPNLLAEGFTQEDAYTPFHLFAGEKQTVTNQIRTGAAGLMQFQTYMYDANGVAIPYDGAADSELIGAAAQPIAANSEGPGYEEGVFNHAALLWPAALDTLDKRKAACGGRTFQVRKLL